MLRPRKIFFVPRLNKIKSDKLSCNKMLQTSGSFVTGQPASVRQLAIS